jgi:ribosomal protein S12 methylthiotransferase
MTEADNFLRRIAMSHDFLQPGIARTEWDAPEIDGSVMVDETLPVGQFADITIGDWRGYDLVAAR